MTTTSAKTLIRDARLARSEGMPLVGCGYIGERPGQLTQDMPGIEPSEQ
jgi:hypothetical protein